jgi:phytol kinase
VTATFAMNPLAPILAVVGALALLMVIVRALRARGLLGPETGRKLVHAAMGTIALSFPWMFAESWPVWALAAAAAAMLGAVRLVPPLATRFGSVLGEVDRNSYGDLLFPLGAATAFELSGADHAAYCAAIGVLAFADTAGALVGLRWGRHRYCVPGGLKSIEGSLAVLVVSFACALVGFSVLGASAVTRGVAVGGGVALVAALVEGAAGFGLDNFLLPAVVVELMAHLRP